MDQIDSGRIVNYYDRLISHEIARPPLGIATTGLLLFMVYYSVFNQFTYFDVGALQTMVIYLPTRLIVWEIARQTPSCFHQLIFIIFIRINRADENIRRSERRIRRISIFPIIWWSASIVVIVKEIWKFSKILNPGILYSISRNERKREETRHFRVEISAGPSIRKEQREEKREREKERLSESYVSNHRHFLLELIINCRHVYRVHPFESQTMARGRRARFGRR